VLPKRPETWGRTPRTFTPQHVPFRSLKLNTSITKHKQVQVACSPRGSAGTSRCKSAGRSPRSPRWTPPRPGPRPRPRPRRRSPGARAPGRLRSAEQEARRRPRPPPAAHLGWAAHGGDSGVPGPAGTISPRKPFQKAPLRGLAAPEAGEGERTRGPPPPTARGARPRDAGPGQGHTAPRPLPARLLCGTPPAGPAIPAPSPPRGLSFPQGPAGPGRGRGGAGGGPRTCGRRRRASRPCPAGWSSSRPRSRSPSRASAQRAARLRHSPPARRSGPPRGSAATRLGTWAAAAPYGKMAAHCRPPRPAPRSGCRATAQGSGASRRLWRRAGGRAWEPPGGASRTATCARGRPYGKMAAPARVKRPSRRGPRVLCGGRCHGWRLRPVRNAASRDLEPRRVPVSAPAAVPPYAEMAAPSALPPRGAWTPRLPVAASRSGPSERRRGQSAAGRERWTQVRRAGAWPLAAALLSPARPIARSPRGGGRAEGGRARGAPGGPRLSSAPCRARPWSRPAAASLGPPAPLGPAGSAQAAGRAGPRPAEWRVDAQLG
jgi:hypothetical protein